MNKLSKLFNKHLNMLLKKNGIDSVVGKLDVHVNDFLNKAVKMIQPRVLKFGKKIVKTQNIKQKKFIKHNELRWSAELELFDIVQYLSLDIVSEIRKNYCSKDIVLFDLLIKLHAHALHVYNEIGCLIKNGYSYAAIARWRALYETYIIASFIQKNGEECAQRFINHSVVDAFNLMKRCNDNKDKINQTPPSDQLMQDCQNDYEKSLELYGDAFKHPYGWASPFLNKGKAQRGFAAIETEVEFNHWRFYYSESSNAVHCSYSSLINKFGLSEANDPLLLIGSSDADMARPLHASVLNLVQFTLLIVNYNTNDFESLVWTKILTNLEKEMMGFFK